MRKKSDDLKRKNRLRKRGMLALAGWIVCIASLGLMHTVISADDAAALDGSAVLFAEEVSTAEEQAPEPGTDGLLPVETSGVDALVDVSADDWQSCFTIKEIHEDSELFRRINGRSYQENDDIALSDLRYLNVLHYDFDHEVRLGELIVNAAIADDCLDIFEKLYETGYEIESMKLVDEYWAGNGTDTDTASIEDNNTSAFCYRTATGGVSLSNHALGCAIDINPRQNPYFSYSTGEAVWFHDGDDAYLDRSAGLAHMITEDDLCYQLFTEYGFTWGGSWNNPKDYQHFERRIYN